MALKPLKREEISKEDLKALVQAAKNQSIGGSYSPVWNEDINVFRASDYKDDAVLIYIPRMPEMLDDDGNVVKYHEVVHSHQLRRLGTDAFAGSYRNTAGMEFPHLGVSGKCPIDDYVQKSFAYYEALKSYELARLYHTDKLENLSEDDQKNFKSTTYKKFPVRTAEASYWFPVFVLDSEKGQNGKRTGTPIFNEEGIATGTMMWYRASDHFWNGALKKAYNMVLPEKETNFEGFLARLDFSLKDADKKDSKVASMQSSNSMSISFIDPGMSKFKELVSKLSEGFDTWDKLAQEKYTCEDLMFDVKATTVYSDADLTEELEKLYGIIEEETAKLNEAARELLAKGTTSAGSSIESALNAGVGGTQQSISGVGDTIDAISFGND